MELCGDNEKNIMGSGVGMSFIFRGRLCCQCFLRTFPISHHLLELQKKRKAPNKSHCFFFLFFLPSKHYVHLYIYFALFMFKTFAFSFRTQKKEDKDEKTFIGRQDVKKEKKKKGWKMTSYYDVGEFHVVTHSCRRL